MELEFRLEMRLRCGRLRGRRAGLDDAGLDPIDDSTGCTGSVGVLRLRLSFASRSSILAQHDRASLLRILLGLP